MPTPAWVTISATVYIGEGDANLGRAFAVVIRRVDDLVNGDYLTLCVNVLGLIQRLTARRRDETAQCVMRVVEPQTVVIVLRTHRAATLQLQAHTYVLSLIHPSSLIRNEYFHAC